MLSVRIHSTLRKITIIIEWHMPGPFTVFIHVKERQSECHKY
ncbi:MAG: hypothetical protein Q4Q24_00585 [Methanobrevibacter ruminantium]|nr:hypothetical protein [Methanobrevibacter ruminantium]MDO5841751.1 hypothetical protein [Methanobrevibacter ruminantium]